MRRITATPKIQAYRDSWVKLAEYRDGPLNSDGSKSAIQETRFTWQSRETVSISSGKLFG